VEGNTKERDGLFFWVRSQLGTELDDERQGHDGEQTGLSSGLACVCCISLQTHRYQDCVQISVMPLDEFLVIFFGHFAVGRVEFSTNVLLGRLFVLSWAVGFDVNQEERKVGRYLSASSLPSTTSPLLLCSPTVPELGPNVRDPVRR